jgi:hypothetical protein
VFHISANFVALANVADTDVPAVPDGIYQINNGHFIYPQNRQLLAAYGSAVNITRLKQNSPKVRQVAPLNMYPLRVGLLPPNIPPICDYRSKPFVLNAQEEQVWLATDSAAGPNNCYVISWTTAQPVPAPIGDIYTLHGASTTAAVASTWTQAAIIWDTQLPAGTYAVIGGFYVATNAIAFSCTFDGQYDRPGGLGSASIGNNPWWGQVKGGLGLWGQFTTVTLPRISVLNDGVDAVHDIYLDVVRIG